MSRYRGKTPAERRRELEEQNSNSSGGSYFFLCLITGFATVLSFIALFADTPEMDGGMKLFAFIMMLFCGFSTSVFWSIMNDEFAREKRIEQEHAKELAEANDYWKKMKELKREDTFRKAKENYDANSRVEYSDLGKFEKEWLDED